MNLDKYRKKSAYNADKRNKADNYSHLNNTVCIPNQTVLAGDSITEMFNMDLFDDYAGRNHIKVYNRGIGGDTSDRLLERLQDNVLVLKPKNIVYLIGTNDFSIGADSEYAFSNIDKILSETRKTCENTRIILQAVYPVSSKISRSTKRKNEKIAQLNSLLPALAEKYNAHFLDLTEQLSDESGCFNSNYTYDGLHPNVYGFEIAVGEIIKLLEQKGFSD